MGYDLDPINKDAGNFHLGAFSWGPLIEACGYLWPFTSRAGQWYCVWGVDPRLGTQYPGIISNDGMHVTEEEARIMARCARNFVAVQRSLPEENMDKSPRNAKVLDRDNLMEAMIHTISGTPWNENWPIKIRTDFVDKYAAFADWAEKSGGFKIY